MHLQLRGHELKHTQTHKLTENHTTIIIISCAETDRKMHVVIQSKDGVWLIGQLMCVRACVCVRLCVCVCKREGKSKTVCLKACIGQTD